jgi:hypothetical protein
MKYILFAIVTICGLAVWACAQNLKADDVVGDWTGDSKCQGTNTFCHDEVVLYRFTSIKTDAAKVHLAADKLVAGKWQLMGEMDFAIDAAKNTLTTEFPIPRTGGKGVLTFAVTGGTMDGVMMIYPENEVGRRIHVERKKN